jgi:hypothetical protein
MALFDIDYNVLVKILIPEQLRNTKMKAWLNILISPVVYVYNLFMTQRYDHLYVLKHSSQVTYMQAVLNDVFDNALRRIIITDNVNAQPVYTYISSESHPNFIYLTSENDPLYLFTSGEDADGFIVQVPSALTFDAAYMSALIDRFRLASKVNYLIKTI